MKYFWKLLIQKIYNKQKEGLTNIKDKVKQINKKMD